MTTHSETHPLTSNRILSALSLKEDERPKAHLEPVAFPLGEVLYQPEEPITYVYFPNLGAVSIVSLCPGGR